MITTFLMSLTCACAAGVLLLAAEDYATALDDKPRAWGCVLGALLCLILGGMVWMI